MTTSWHFQRKIRFHCRHCRLGEDTEQGAAALSLPTFPRDCQADPGHTEAGHPVPPAPRAVEPGWSAISALPSQVLPLSKAYDKDATLGGDWSAWHRVGPIPSAFSDPNTGLLCDARYKSHCLMNDGIGFGEGGRQRTGTVHASFLESNRAALVEVEHLYAL